MDVNGLLTGCSVEQRKWVMARLLTTSDAEAARAVGVHPATVCRWPNKSALDAAVDALLTDTALQAINMLAEAAPEAAAAKVAALRSHRDTVRQAAATEILDRTLGKAKQVQETTLTGALRLDHTFDAALAKVYGDDGGA
jgi:hypothetical protein